MSNKKILQEIKKNLNKAKAPAKKADIDYVSKMGYRDDSPFNKRKSITIDTKDGSIDMSNTGRPLLANGKYLPPYSGVHQFNTNKVTEVPLDEAKKGGSKKYSKSLLAKNRLFAKNPLFKKKNYKNKIYDPSAMYFENGGELECPEGFYNDPVQGCVPIEDPNKFYENWFKNRVMPTPEGQKLLDKIRPEALERSRESVPYIFNESLGPNEAGYYDVDTRQIMLNKFLPEAQIQATKYHERMHDIQAGNKFSNILEKPQGYLVEQNIIEPKAINTGNPEWDKNLKKNYEDIVDPNEIHARVMTLRRLAGFRPDQTISEKDLQDYFKAVKDSGDKLDPDIEDLKGVTKGNKSIVNLLNDMVSVPGQTEDIPYLQPGGELSSDVSVSYLPNEERSYYNPLIDTVYLNPNASEEELNHEMAHAWQNRNDGFRSDPYSPKLRPSTAASDEQAATYFNRKGDDVDRYINNLKTIVPELGGHTWNADLDRFIPDQLKYDKVIDPLMYSDPSTLEGEAEYMSQVYGRPPLGIKKDGGEKEAMIAMMKARLAYANMFGNPSAQRMINIPDQPYEFDNGDTGTHYMASMDNYAVPQIQSVNGVLQIGNYGPESSEAIRFDSDEDANYFAEHYKDVSPGFMDLELTKDEIKKYVDGGYVVEDISVPSLTRMQFAGEVPDSTYTPIDPNFLAENPDIYSQIVNKPEVTTERQGSDIGKLRAEYREKNPLDIFLDEKKRQYLKKNKGLNKAAGVTMDNFPEDVLQNFMNEYDYKTNTYAVNKLGKKEGWNPKRRGEWVDELTPGERDAVAESKYGSKLQPSYWSRSLAGVQELGNTLLPGQPFQYNIPGLTKKEQKEMRDSKLSALETLAPIDIPGAAITNFVKNTGLSTGSDYKDMPGVLSGEKMANVSDMEAMALNPLTYVGLEALPELGVNLVKGVKALPGAIRTSKESGLLSNTYKLNPFAGKLGEYNRIVGQDAILDLQNSGIVRAGEYGGVESNFGSFDGVRTTPYPSFGKGAPRQAYIDQTIQQGKIPHVISTDRPMGVSTLGRHGKGSTMFPIDETGKYMSAFPADEVRVFGADPHWLKGYKEVPVELPGSPNTSISDKLKQFFDRPPGPLMIGLGSGSKFTRSVPNPDYFLDVMKLNKYSPTQKKYFESLIQTVKNQGNKASELQFEELQRIKTGDYNYGKRGIPYEALTVQKETPVFKSEIDWVDWVKKNNKNYDAEDIQNVIKNSEEYNIIEQQTKANGTWMKNADGTPFQGTPEQFIQQQSTKFKQAYPEGTEITYRGGDKRDALKSDWSSKSNVVFTTKDEYGARAYNKTLDQPPLVLTEAPPEGISQLYMPKTTNKIVIDGNEYPVGHKYRSHGFPYINDAGKEVYSPGSRTNYARLNAIDQVPANELEAKNLEAFKTWMLEKHPTMTERGFSGEPRMLNDWVMTDHFADFLNSPAGKDISRVEFQKIIDGTLEPIDVEVHNLNEAQQLKSMWGNSGEFDLTNPNKFKALLPYLIPTGLGVGAASQMQGQESNEGYKQGGIVSNLTKKEIDKLIKQGYIIEEID